MGIPINEETSVRVSSGMWYLPRQGGGGTQDEIRCQLVKNFDEDLGVFWPSRLWGRGYSLGCRVEYESRYFSTKSMRDEG